MEPIAVSTGIRVPPDAITVRFARSSGPGGQNVNKVASKVHLRVDLSKIEGLSDAARGRLDRMTRRRRDARGLLLVVSQRSRDQYRNLEDARERVRALVAMALVTPKERRPTGPTTSSREKRLATKRRTALRKLGRRREDDD